MANGASNPSLFAATRNLRALGYDCDVDDGLLKPVEEHLANIARRENLPVGTPLEFDYRQYLHQVPGGMISNLRHQLTKVGMEHRLAETLEEAARVRTDFGYPIMVTPLAQFVGSQAAINVITGGRYRQVTDEVIHYALGHWGAEAIEVMDAEVRATILSRARARELERWEKPEPTLRELRRKYGENLSDEELVLRIYAGEFAVGIARNAPQPTEYSDVQSLLRVVETLASSGKHRFVSLASGEMSIVLKR